MPRAERTVVEIEVEPVVTDREMGGWDLRPKACPAAAHLAALSMKPWTCKSGIVTNFQGAVPLRSCEHVRGDVNDKQPPTIMCAFQEAAARKGGR